MVLRSLLREWRERRDGTLEGPALDTKEQDNGQGKEIYCGNQDGSTVDERFDNAIATATVGDDIILELGGYSANRTGADSIDKRVDIIGMGFDGGGDETSEIDADWEITETSVMLSRVRVLGSVTMTGADSHLKTVKNNSSVTIEGDRTVVYGRTGSGSLDVSSAADSATAAITPNINVTQ